MGIEYRHFLVVADPAWLPQSDTLLRVDAVLRKWSLVADEPDVFDLSGGRKRRRARIHSTPPGPGIAVLYPMLEGSTVLSLFGPSYYPNIPDQDRYIQQIAVVAGLDFRIHWSSESICFTVVEPPHKAGVAVKPYTKDQHLYLYSESYLADASTTPPTVKIEVDEKARDHVAWQGYSGFWRGGLVLDCGKDLPAFIGDCHALPSRQFVQEVSEAFRSVVQELGEIC